MNSCGYTIPVLLWTKWLRHYHFGDKWTTEWEQARHNHVYIKPTNLDNPTRYCQISLQKLFLVLRHTHTVLIGKISPFHILRIHPFGCEQQTVFQSNVRPFQVRQGLWENIPWKKRHSSNLILPPPNENYQYWGCSLISTGCCLHSSVSGFAAARAVFGFQAISRGWHLVNAYFRKYIPRPNRMNMNICY